MTEPSLPASLEALLASLNPQQREAVTAPPGPILVWAGPGSGKTRVLTYRVAYLIAAYGVSPWNILAVTFTNKAAREMEERLEQLLGPTRASGLTVGTFHAFCARLLRQEAAYHPFTSRFVIADTDDQRRLLQQAMKDLNISEAYYPISLVHTKISQAKNAGLWPEDYPQGSPRDRTIAKIYQRYQALLEASRALDFDDLLLWAVRLLSEYPGLREKYARRYQHILVDEFQDTNTLQYHLVRLLAQDHRRLFVVGDMDQAIYRWRGADYKNLERFQRDFPEARVIPLEENYRSTQFILDAAMGVIRPLHRKPKRLYTRRGQGRRVVVKEVRDTYQEATYVVETILELVRAGEARLGDVAIMYRTNAQSRVLEERFLEYRLPYRLVGAQRFYGRREVKDLLAYLRLIYNPADESSLLRIINVPPRGIGMKTLAALRAYAQRQGKAAGEVLLDLAHDPDAYHAVFPGRMHRVLYAFAVQLKTWQEEALGRSPLALLDRIIEDVGYEAYVRDGSEEGEGRWENVQELRRIASEYPPEALEAFLEDVALVSDQDTLENGDAPTLLTLHAAKGLEFPVVFIVGLVEGLLPHERSMHDPESLNEERRLFYVGITRAMNRLYLVVPRTRWAFGVPEPQEPSRFLKDLPMEAVEGDLPKLFPELRRAAREPSSRRTRRESRAVPAYRVGMRVRHARWGEGTVVSVEEAGGDQILMVAFDGGTTKPLLASMAPLEVVES